MNLRELRAGFIASFVSLPAAYAAFCAGLFPVDFARVTGHLLTPNERRARRLGSVTNILSAVGMAWGYQAAFRKLGWRPGPMTGSALGMAQGAAAIVGLLGLSHVHPRRKVASLPPSHDLRRDRSFFAVAFAGHAVYGAILGALLRCPRTGHQKRLRPPACSMPS